MDKKKSILRIIDVNLNRLREGLRVCEEITRFILTDESSTKKLKAMRHEICRIIDSSKTTQACVCSFRNVREDCATEFSLLEGKDNWQSIFFANCQRAKESLRVLEEFFKLFDNKTSEKFKGMRFEVYEFEKKIIKKTKTLSDSRYNLPQKAVNR